jgi:glycosyltransferase involved in cell wall biosynthesis
LQHELGIATTDIVITYLGTFFHFSGLDIVIKELASKLKTFEKVKLLLIGGGSQEHYLKKLATELNLDSKVIFTGFVPYAELSKFLALSTVAINPMQPGLVSNTAFPHKVIQYMASGIPVVSTRLEGLYKTFGENAGITWNYGPEGIVAKALELAQDPQKLSVCSKLGLEALDSKFDSDSAITNFEASIRELTK